MSDIETGRLIGIGVGPGDSDLLTVKAVKILKTVPVIAYIHAEGRASLARAIAAPHLGTAKAEVAMPVPMESNPAAALGAYDAHMPAIRAHLDQGADVAVLCEGDPFFYGSFIYIHDRLAGGYRTEVVPGITSLSAAAALSRRALAARGQTFTALPATLGEDDLMLRLAGAENAALMKLGRNLGKVRRVLRALGLESRALYLERIGHDDERVLPFSETEDIEAGYFSLVLVQGKEAG